MIEKIKNPGDLSMQYSNESSLSSEKKTEIGNEIRIDSQFKNRANWFYWIAALSFINSLIIILGGEISFIVGLGATQILDAIALGLKTNSSMNLDSLLFIISLFISGIFDLFGYFAKLKHMGIFITGMILYGLDGLIFFLIGDWLGFGFHVFVLFGLWGGLKALKIIKAKEGEKSFLSEPI